MISERVMESPLSPDNGVKMLPTVSRKFLPCPKLPSDNAVLMNESNLIA